MKTSNVKNRSTNFSISWPEYGIEEQPCDLVGELRIGTRDYTLYRLREPKKSPKRPVVIMAEAYLSRAGRRWMVTSGRAKARRFTLAGALSWLAAIARATK